MVSYAFGSLYGRDVGVDQDRFHTVFAQCFERLCARVIELSRLAYLECSGPEQNDFLDC